MAQNWHNAFKSISLQQIACLDNTNTQYHNAIFINLYCSKTNIVIPLASMVDMTVVRDIIVKDSGFSCINNFCFPITTISPLCRPQLETVS